VSGGVSEPHPLNLGPHVAGGAGPAAEPGGRVDAADAHVARDDRTLQTGSTGQNYPGPQGSTVGQRSTWVIMVQLEQVKQIFLQKCPT